MMQRPITPGRVHTNMSLLLTHHLSSRAALASAAVLVLLSGLAGCAHNLPLPAAGAAVPVPAQWSVAPVDAANAATAVPVTALSGWWRAFNDPQLTGLIDQALQANTSVRSAQAALQQARALRDVATANRGPALALSGSAQRSKQGQASPANTFRAGFDASWEPDVFGGLGAAVTASEADVQAATASLGQVRVSLAAEVAVSYIELRGMQSRLAIARSNLAAQQETLQLTEWRVQAGLASSLDLEQAKTATAQTQAQIPALEASVAQTLNSLAVLTGRVPGALASVLGVAAVPVPPAGLALSFPADTLRQRPDVRVAEEQMRSAWAQVAEVDAARYPSFSLSGSLGLNAARLADLTDTASLLRTLLGSVSYTLFDGGAAQARVRAQQAAFEQARVNHEAVLLTALQDVEDTLVSLKSDSERLHRLSAAAESAANADLLARNRYASGLIDFATVLDTQKTLLAAQSELEVARTAWSTDHVRLYKALGGGWTPEPEPQP